MLSRIVAFTSVVARTKKETEILENEIKNFVEQNPAVTFKELKEVFNLYPPGLSRILKRLNITLSDGRKKVQDLKTEVQKILNKDPEATLHDISHELNLNYVYLAKLNQDLNLGIELERETQNHGDVKQKILDALQQDPTLTRDQLSLVLNIPKSTLYRYVRDFNLPVSEAPLGRKPK